MKLRVIASAVAALTLAAGLTGCGGSTDAAGSKTSADCKPASQFDTLKKGSLTVAVYEAPPYVTFKGNELGGVDGDILMGFAEKQCLTINAVSAAAAAVIPTVQGGRADVATGGWWRSKARADILSLTDPIYTDQMVLISKDGLNKVTDLKGKKVGTVNGNVWVDDAKSYLGGDLQLYKAPVDLFQDLKSGRLDVGIDGFGEAHNNSNGLKVEVLDPDSAIKASLEPPQTCFPVTKDNAGLLKALNEYVDGLRKDGGLEKIVVKNGFPASAINTGDARLIG
ncbi:transporter substrate-binding domain-containing protein [Paenarthrobacter sp. NPDC089714]|uniref:substrate-binding periplasmic protein n=1 Tax=unclassified Paenarthrobacter TaxID=2634190 RepID=UPI00381488FD